jgi:hypothetical protein
LSIVFFPIQASFDYGSAKFFFDGENLAGDFGGFYDSYLFVEAIVGCMYLGGFDS